MECAGGHPCPGCVHSVKVVGTGGHHYYRPGNDRKRLVVLRVQCLLDDVKSEVGVNDLNLADTLACVMVSIHWLVDIAGMTH